MALKTYPNTPEEEAAAINAKSGDPNGITAEQVAANRRLNEQLTAGFLGGFSSGFPSAPSINPQSELVAKISASLKQAEVAAQEAQPKIQEALDKAQLDAKVAKLSGSLGSGLNQASTGFGDFKENLTTGMGNIVSASGGLTDKLSTLASGIGSGVNNALGSLQKLAGATSNAGADITSTLSKLGGGNLAGGIMQAASKISSAAGVLNNLLSMKRAVNLPQGGELFDQTGQAIQLSSENSEDWRVRLNCDWTIFRDNPLFERFKEGGVVFPILPEITFSTKANYTQIEPTHNNYPFQAYKNSQVDEISIAGQFISETNLDAAYWVAATTFFKTATKMFYGKGDNVGAPPIICLLNGYGASVFNDVPVVVKSFSVDFPKDVNYVKCTVLGTATWVPILSTISITVQPVYNRRNLRQFSLEDYAKGTLTTPTGQGYL